MNLVDSLKKPLQASFSKKYSCPYHSYNPYPLVIVCLFFESDLQFNYRFLTNSQFTNFHLPRMHWRMNNPNLTHNGWLTMELSLMLITKNVDVYSESKKKN